MATNWRKNDATKYQYAVINLLNIKVPKDIRRNTNRRINCGAASDLISSFMNKPISECESVMELLNSKSINYEKDISVREAYDLIKEKLFKYIGVAGYISLQNDRKQEIKERSMITTEEEDDD